MQLLLIADDFSLHSSPGHKSRAAPQFPHMDYSAYYLVDMTLFELLVRLNLIMGQSA